MSRRGREYVVLVTGSSGFLGQHLVGLLHNYADHVTEIRVLDTQPYVNNTEYKIKKPMKEYVGCILDIDVMTEACKGVDCVIHLASIIDISLFPDYERSYRIHVEGTRTIIEACRRSGVKRLIYCSSAAVIVGHDDVIDGTEDELEYPDEHMFPVYGKTKQKAEELVLEANDGSLQTVSIRPTAIYGDLDWKTFGQMYGNPFTMKTGYYIHVDFSFQHCNWIYVGNVAWAFIQADNILCDNRNQNAAGETYFITDDTPLMVGQSAMFEMAHDSGLQRLFLSPPMWLHVQILRVILFVLTLLSLFWKIEFPFGKWSVRMRNKIWLVSRQKAESLLGYKPLFEHDEVKRRVTSYIKSISQK